ncbi:MAG TPA: DUF4446 domain-containing protein [Bacteroides sp.]|nr:DUF4446 domain-containing protein [Bacteroides sp.]
MVNFFGLFSVDMQYVIIAVLVMGIISIVSLILAIVAICKMGHTRKKYENFMEGKDARSLEPLLKERFKEIEDLKRINAKNVKNIKFLLDKIHYSYQKVGIVKYDAFHEMGGKLSFALTMLDNKNNGFIINSMHSREGCYMYIKEIVAGESYIELGEEETESLEKAIAGPLGDTELGHMNEVINNTVDINELDEALDALGLDDTELAEAEAAAAKEQQEQEQQN